MHKVLLTICADRGKYYYAVADLFQRHTGVVKVFLDDGLATLPDLLAGLMWRSRIQVNIFLGESTTS